jgi:hypothetical protein
MKIYDLSEEKFSFMDMASHFAERAGPLPLTISSSQNSVSVRQIRTKLAFQSRTHAAESL